MISVIIPTCDRPTEYLCTAIDSVLAQSLPAGEIIVVDNGTKDVDPTALPAEVTLYRLPPRVGPSRARNFGAAMAQGTHLAFLDDDDWWDVDFLKEASAVLKAEETSCVYGRKDIFREGVISRYKCPTTATLTTQQLLKRNPGTSGSNILVAKSVFFRVGGFDHGLHSSEDRALALNILLAGEKLSVAENAVAVMRNHAGERARQRLSHRLLFTWKFRSHLNRKEFVSEISKATLKAVQSQLGRRLRLLHARVANRLNRS